MRVRPDGTKGAAVDTHELWRLRSPQERAGFLLGAGAAVVAALTLVVVLVAPPSGRSAGPANVEPPPPVAAGATEVPVGVHATAAGPAPTPTPRVAATTRPAEPDTEATGDAEDGDDADGDVPVEAADQRAPSPPPTTAAPPVSFTGTVEAEAATLTGPEVRTLSCGFCSGGRLAAFIGRTNSVTFAGVRVPTTGTYPLTITYLGDNLAFYVSVNGGNGVRVLLDRGSWTEARTATIQVSLTAGVANTIRFYNTGDWAPGLDKISIG
jgi:hypothetical protein